MNPLGWASELTGEGAAALVDRRFGCWVPTRSSPTAFADIEEAAGRRFDVFSTFIDLDSAWCGRPGADRPRVDIAAAATRGLDLAVAMAPSRWGAPVLFADILAGHWDDHLAGWLTYLSGLGVPVALRWGWEMNVGSTPWSPLHPGGHCVCRDAEEYVAVWHHLVTLGRAVASGPIRWWWCPGAQDVPARPGAAPIALERFYPGSDWIDLIGYDTYNGYGPWTGALSTLRGAGAGEGSAYDRVTALHPSAPVWIGEIGCAEDAEWADGPTARPGSRKATWWTELFALGGDLPRLRGICLFSEDGRPATHDWRLDSSDRSWAAFVRGFAGSGVATGGPVAAQRAGSRPAGIPAPGVQEVPAP